MSRLSSDEPIVENEQKTFHQTQPLEIIKVSDALASASIADREPEESDLANTFKLVMTDAYSYSPGAHFGTANNQASSQLPLLTDSTYPSRNMLKARIPHRTRAQTCVYVKTRPSQTLVARFLEAVSLNNTEKVTAMIQKGMSPNTSEGFFSRSALHIACSRGYLDMIKVLLESGANPNIRDKNLNTPLHLATCTENIEVVQTLLDYGTNVLLKDSKGHLALEIAISKLRLSERTRTMVKRGTRVQIVTVCERIFAAFREQRSNPQQQGEFTRQDLEDMFQNFSTQLDQVRRRQLEIDTIGSIDSIVDKINNLQLKLEIDNDVDSLLSTLHQVSLKS
uniref:Uncharacterized protein n=1 Tax=Anopheles atroparvus TaxID=41427 RepID=A0AAG5DL42_ANOAO